jgi:hypothetical protein
MARITPTFEFKPGSLGRNLKNFDGDIGELVAGVVDYQGTQAVGWMKTNAPWTDRTGNARNTLGAYGLHTAECHESQLHGGVPYQIWLEIRWGGKYAIIRRAVKIQGLALMNRLRGLARRLGRL